MNQQQLKNLTVGEIVTEDFRTSEVFKKAGIDFCCGGNQSFEDACREKSIEPDLLAYEIEKIKHQPQNPSFDFKSWDPVFLCDYIVNTHHKFVLKNLPDLVFYTQKISDVHGENHPELNEVAKLFGEINKELLQHLKNEEEVLFPAIREVVHNPSENTKKTIQTEIERMFGEHDFAGGSMDEINRITHGYALPDDACNTYQVAFRLLNQFEDDLHVHVHLENNILFPKALSMAGK
jgi:regulator of cell morphogenesis and NO signaling